MLYPYAVLPRVLDSMLVACWLVRIARHLFQAADLRLSIVLCLCSSAYEHCACCNDHFSVWAAYFIISFQRLTTLSSLQTGGRKSASWTWKIQPTTDTRMKTSLCGCETPRYRTLGNCIARSITANHRLKTDCQLETTLWTSYTVSSS